ncbi:DUF262 domain-containing protein [Helicobacter felis]|uniref:DUF262 domain-containing protein n=1 Tax=Helicobacter felis TaxID=214 RepID=UPI001F488C22|nr:DUF262 domain-containing protein [Helicobacter felis]
MLGEKQCTQLWEDIVAFFEGGDSAQLEDDPYFLGSIVMYSFQGAKEQYIVDGQQHTTTFVLLLRAMHAKLVNENNTNIKGVIDSIQSCLWRVDHITKEPDYNAPHLRSEAVADEERAILERILKEGLPAEELIDDKNASNYEKNYRYFCQQLDEFAKKYPNSFHAFCVCVLRACIVLPIGCEGQDGEMSLEFALCIFHTLNARGLPLNDTDIFKSVIFTYKKGQEREAFIQRWKELEQITDMEFLFRQYMHVVRAQKGDKSREIGLRTFFLNKHKQMLQDSPIMQNIETLDQFWYEEEVYSKYSLKSLQFYDILHLTENEYWKCLDSAYYMYCLEKGKDYFKNHEEFLMRLCAHLLLYSISKKTISFKNVIYNAYTSLIKPVRWIFTPKVKTS